MSRQTRTGLELVTVVNQNEHDRPTGRRLPHQAGRGCGRIRDRCSTAQQPDRYPVGDTVASAVVTRPRSQTTGMRPRRLRPAPATRSAFAGFRFPPDVIVLATRWYLRFGLSYRDVEEPLAERGIEVDHVTVSRWVQRFTPLLAEAARPCRHAVGDRWFVDETYVKVAGRWRYVYRAIDQFDRSSTCSSPHGATPRQPIGSFSAPSARPRY
jgi:hypothetical protein